MILYNNVLFGEDIFDNESLTGTKGRYFIRKFFTSSVRILDQSINHPEIPLIIPIGAARQTLSATFFSPQWYDLSYKLISQAIHKTCDLKIQPLVVNINPVELIRRRRIDSEF